MIISGDASQLEWRVAVELSKDRVGLKEIQEGADTHTNNQEAFKLPTRHIAKIYLFRTIYRGSGYAFSKDNDFSHVSSSPRFWDNVNSMFYEKYFGLDLWHMNLCNLVMTYQPIVSPLGREWLITPKENKRTGEPEPPWSVFTNYPVQGCSADVMTIARLSLQKRLNNAKIRYKFISTVHDSIVLDVPNDENIQLVVNIFNQVFDDLAKNIKKLFGYTWETPLACECKVGMDLFNMKKVMRDDV